MSPEVNQQRKANNEPVKIPAAPQNDVKVDVRDEKRGINVLINLTLGLKSINEIRQGQHDSLTFGTGCGSYGSTSQEKETAKILQAAINMANNALNPSSKPIAIDGTIRPGGETHLALERFIELENDKRKKEGLVTDLHGNKHRLSRYIPGHTVTLTPTLIAALSRYCPGLNDSRFGPSNIINSQSYVNLKDVLSDREYLNQGKSGPAATEVNRLLYFVSRDNALLTGDSKNPFKDTITPDTINILEREGLFPSRSYSPHRREEIMIGPQTALNLFKRVVEKENPTKG